MNPFPVSASDAALFWLEVGYQLALNLPSWGSIVEWRSRYILVFPAADGSFRLTDISGGIPDSGVPGGRIPIESIIATATSQNSIPGPVMAFIYSIPSNFVQVAKEDAIAVAGGIGGAIVDSFPVTLPIIAVGIAVLLFFYGPRMQVSRR